MKELRLVIFVAFFLALSFSRSPAEEARTKMDPGQAPAGIAIEQEQAETPDPDEAAPKKAAEEISDAELLVELQGTIRSDKARLAELKAELEKREKDFAGTNKYWKKTKKQLEKKKEELGKLGAEKSSAGRKALTSEIETLEKDQALLKERTDLVYQAVKTTKEQIETLAEKIEKNLQAVARLSGSKVQTKQEEVAPPPKAPETIPATSLGTIPGMPSISPGAEEPLAEEEAPPDTLETPEQIEARKQAEKKEHEAREAAAVIVEYVDRKAVLQEQIALEKQSMKTAKESLRNLEGLLATREKLMDEKIAAGAGKAELRKLQKEIEYIQGEMKKLHDEIDRRNDRLGDLYDQLERIGEEQIQVMGKAEHKREEAQKARKRSMWLESPLYPRNIAQWFVTRAPRMLAILVATFLILLVVRFALKKTSKVIIMSGFGETEQREKRATTLGSTLTSAATGIILIAGLLLALEEAGVDIKAVLGGAAVLGLAVAFGAQNLMRDYFNGFMILMEGQFELNDIISIGDVTGRVERMSMRMTLLRDLEGRAHFGPNGQIKQVTNFTHAWSQALFNIGVSYQENVDAVMEVLMDVAGEFCRDPEFGPFTIGEPQMLGVDDLGEAAFRVKFIIRTKADKMWPVKREMLRRIKNRFDEMGIRVPLPHRVILQGQNFPERSQES